MPYELTRSDLDTINDAELAFSTERLLPAWDEIPEDFRRGNLYTQVAESIFFGRTLPHAEMAFKPEFADPGVAQALNRCVRAHLQSWGPKYQHKIAGVGFMIAQCCEMRLLSEDNASEGANGKPAP